MISTLFQSPFVFFLTAIGLILAITIHEYSHALAADRLGDPTARSQGRLSLNPIRHLDPIGTLLLFIAGFGWGKPVQFDPYNLEQPRRDAALISFAGPLSNLVLAFILTIAGKFLAPTIFPFLLPLIYINVGLAVFNLVPVHPLDGAKILIGLLPRDLAYEFDSIMSRYGTLLLILLIFPFFGTSPVLAIITPIIGWITSALLSI